MHRFNDLLGKITQLEVIGECYLFGHEASAISKMWVDEYKTNATKNLWALELVRGNAFYGLYKTKSIKANNL